MENSLVTIKEERTSDPGSSASSSTSSAEEEVEQQSSSMASSSNSCSPLGSQMEEVPQFEDRLRILNSNQNSDLGKLVPYDLQVWVGSARFNLYKDLFVLSSPRFAELFEARAGKSDRDEMFTLHLSDISKEQFMFIRHFICNGVLKPFCKLGQQRIDLTLELKKDLLRTSQKFELKLLEAELIKNIEDKMQPRDAFQALDLASDMDLKSLHSTSLKNISLNAEELLKNNLDDFCKLGQNNVINILSNDNLRCNEVTVFEAAVRWAAKQARCSNDSPTKIQSLQYYFNQLSSYIRYPLMSVQDFGRLCRKYDVLGRAEENKIFRYLTMTDEEKVAMVNFSYNSNPRANLLPTDIHQTPKLDTDLNNKLREEEARKLMPPPPPPSFEASSPDSPQKKKSRLSLLEVATASSPDSPQKKKSRLSLLEVATASSTNNANRKRKAHCSRNASSHSSVDDEYGDDDSGSDSDEELFVKMFNLRKSRFECQSFQELGEYFKVNNKDEELLSVRMDNVTLKKLHHPIIRKMCRDIKLDIKYNFIEGSGEAGGPNANNFKYFISNFDPMRYLVIQNQSSPSLLTPANIWDMEQNVHLKFNGVTMLKVHHRDPQKPGLDKDVGDILVLNYLKDSRLILSNENFKPEVLALSNCEFSTKLMKDKHSNLKHLIFYRVWGDFTMEEIMKNYANLETLIMWKFIPKSLPAPGNVSHNSMRTPLCVDFSLGYGRSTIQKLVLFQVEVKFSFSTRSQFCYPSVTELQLDHCHVKSVSKSANIANVFHDLFPNLEWLYLAEDNEPESKSNKSHPEVTGNMAKPDLVHCAVTKLQKIKSIRVVGLKWRNKNGSLVSNESVQLGHFLKSLKIKENSTNFSLKKHGGWEGQDLSQKEKESVNEDGGYHTYMDQLEYESYELNNFYASCEAFEDYFINDQEKFPEWCLF